MRLTGAGKLPGARIPNVAMYVYRESVYIGNKRLKRHADSVRHLPDLQIGGRELGAEKDCGAVGCRGRCEGTNIVKSAGVQGIEDDVRALTFK
jgi:hypothetical protein